MSARIDRPVIEDLAAIGLFDPRRRTAPLPASRYQPSQTMRGETFVIRRGVRTAVPAVLPDERSGVVALAVSIAAAFAMGVIVGIIIFGWITA